MPININTVVTSAGLVGASEIRDFLLNKNLILSESIINYGLSSYGTGLGKFPIIGDGINAVKDTTDIKEDGVFYRDLNLLPNLFKNPGIEEEIDISLNPVVGALPSSPNNVLRDSKGFRKGIIKQNLYTEDLFEVASIETNVLALNQKKGYLTENVNIMGGSVTSQSINVIGSVLTGNGVGVTSGGLVPDFDLRASLAGRVLGASGILNDTPIGQAGQTYLGLALANNAAFNLQQETTGRINTTVSSLLRGDSIIVPNYSISVPTTGLGKGIDLAARMLGFEVPVSILTSDTSIFDKENPISNISRGNALIQNTGRGQVVALFSNLRENKYAPAFDDKRITDDGLNPNLYAFDDGKGGVLDVLHGDTSNPVSQSNYSHEYNDVFDGLYTADYVYKTGNKGGFAWDDPNANSFNAKTPKKESLLNRTKELFDSGKMRTLINNVSGDGDTEEVQNTNIKGKISKGSALTSDGKEFCRVWTKGNGGYSTLNDLQKHRGIDKRGGVRNNIENSVLQDNGFPKIAPEIHNDTVSVKNFMFSIENLAWSDNVSDLPLCEIGPGDIVSKTQGRIMWFPPYDLNFTDNTSVNWDTSNFIGRGEPIYTYNNTERSGTLQFKIVVDYPNTLNDLRFSTDEYLIDSVLGGCQDIPDSIAVKLSENEINALKVKGAQVKQQKTATPIDTLSFNVYFPNNSSEVKNNYEIGAGPIGAYVDDSGGTEIDTSDFSKNTDYKINMVDNPSNTQLTRFLLETCPACTVELIGYKTSRGGDIPDNQGLAKKRAEAVKAAILALSAEIDPIRINVNKKENIVDIGTPTPLSYSNDIEKEGRKVSVKVFYDANKDTDVNTANPKLLTTEEQTFRKAIKARFINECEYFYKLEEDNPFITNAIKDRLMNFSPGFHSTTPEGLNSRLTFLQQCTRQGPTKDKSQPDNLAFGKPPVCILRIGDFYHTKIVIDSVNFSFDPLVWDLNPEGIGVQPMIATVDMSFKFIGGSSLAGPISRLQNAVTFNYFGNTEVYDQRADSVKDGGYKRGNPVGDTSKNAPKDTDSSQGGGLASKNIVVEDNQFKIAENESKKQ